MRKQAFASVCLFGEDNNSSISGVWVWRGHDLAFEVIIGFVVWLNLVQRQIRLFGSCYLQQIEGYNRHPMSLEYLHSRCKCSV